MKAIIRIVETIQGFPCFTVTDKKQLGIVTLLGFPSCKTQRPHNLIFKTVRLSFSIPTPVSDEDPYLYVPRLRMGN